MGAMLAASVGALAGLASAVEDDRSVVDQLPRAVS
jgi:hypothetical protein